MLRADQFTSETRAGILYRLALGMNLSEAAQAVGVNPATARGWLFRGRREKTGELAAFAAEVDATRVVSTATPTDATELSKLVRAGSIRAAKTYWERFVLRA